MITQKSNPDNLLLNICICLIMRFHPIQSHRQGSRNRKQCFFFTASFTNKKLVLKEKEQVEEEKGGGGGGSYLCEYEYRDVLFTMNAHKKEKYDSIVFYDVTSFLLKVSERYKPSNRLQPTKYQYYAFQHILNTDFPELRCLYQQKMHTDGYVSTQEQWEWFLELYRPQNRRKLLDFDVLGGCDQQDDLDERASILVNRILNNPFITSLHTMDGHGRLILRVVSKLLDREPQFFITRPTFYFHVYDIDEVTNLWHELILPHACTIVKQDIFETLLPSIETGDIQTQLFYLNFCGLMGQGPQVYDMYEMLSKKEQHSLMNNLVVSFSNIREGQHAATQLCRQLMELNCRAFGYNPKHTCHDSRCLLQITQRSFCNNIEDCSSIGDFVTIGILE